MFALCDLLGPVVAAGVGVQELGPRIPEKHVQDDHLVWIQGINFSLTFKLLNIFEYCIFLSFFGSSSSFKAHLFFQKFILQSTDTKQI